MKIMSVFFKDTHIFSVFVMKHTGEMYSKKFFFKICFVLKLEEQYDGVFGFSLF